MLAERLSYRHQDERNRRDEGADKGDAKLPNEGHAEYDGIYVC